MKKFNLLKVLSGISLFTPIIAITSCSQPSYPIAILYTNDVHCALDKTDGLTYSNVKGFKNQLEEQGYKTILVDSGDFSSGGIYGSFNKGKYITEIMNTCSYDLCVPGNHEFDYGMARFYEIKDELKMPMLSSNFYHMKDGQNTDRVLDDTKVLNVGNKKIGFVGVSTPDTLTTSNPKNFMDDQGNYIYGFCHDSTTNFYSCIQKSIDSLTQQNCDTVIALSHLGESTDREFNSVDLVKNTTGLNAVLDGHSHTFNPASVVKNKDGKDVVISQTGTNLTRLGCMTIDKRNNLSFSMINSCQCHDDSVDKVLKKVKDETDPILNQEIGTLGITLTTKDSDGQRLVRKGETNLGDLTADAIKAYCYDESSAPDFGIIIGGGVRQDINKGTVTNKDVLNVLPFTNELWKLKLSGSKILDVLEWGMHKLDKTKSEEWGGYLQISDGLTFDVNLAYDTPCLEDASGFIGFDPDKPRRVENVKINGEALDKTKDYIMVGVAYTIRDYGDGYNMLKEGVESIDMEQRYDYEALAKYLKDNMSQSWFNDYYKESKKRITLLQ